LPSHRRCVALDFDGTLVDSLPALRRAYGVFLGQFGIEGTDEEFRRLNGPNMSTIVALLKDWHDLPAPHDVLLSQYYQLVERVYRTDVRGAEGADELLRWLPAAGYARALVTSSPRSAVAPVLDRLKWCACFEVTAYGDEVPCAKPDPAVYHLACERGGWAPRECVAVEDAPAGVEAAVACGLAVIGLGLPDQWPRLRACGAQWTCATLAEVRGVIESAW
jgi:beta-phosphoglucomutase